MTEAEWLAATDPSPMLDLLQGRASGRKLILFCLYWCPLYGMERANGDPAYDRAMRFAEFGDNLEELRLAWADPDGENEPSMPERPLDWARLVTDPALRAELATPAPEHAPRVLRDIFGNPFRPVSLSASWHTSTVVQLADGIYQERAFDRLPILADALQDAGCHNEDILDHCRDASATHVRGCWAVDLMLGKK